MRVLVTVTNPDGTAERASDATAAPVSPFPPANIVAPVVTGTPQRSRTLYATRGTWTGPDNMYTYQWQRDFGEGYVDIAGATGSAYTLTVADVDATVRVLVTATNPDATIVEASEPTTPVLPAGPLNQSSPTVGGTAQRGLTLIGGAGSWSGIGNSYAYRWQSSTDGATWTNITGATSSTYAIGVGDVGSHLRLLVTVTNPDGTASAVSTATGKVTSAPPVNTVKPALSGTAQRASTLTATSGSWSGNGNAYTYQWQRDTVDIPGATDPAYTLTVADVNTTVRVVVTAANPDGTAAAASAPTATIPSAPPVNTISPTLTGTARRGATLTGTTGTWSGIGNSTSFQWQRSRDLGASWQAIDGATSPTYVLTVADVGASVRVLVTMTNPEGSASKASNATAAVVGDGPVSTSAPTISGTAQRTATLTSTPGTWSGSGNTISYQWQRSAGVWVNIEGATGAAYELTPADVGATVRLLVTATNHDGAATRASAPTTTVKTAPPVNTSLPTVTGATLRGTTLTASPGTWSGPAITYAYQWQHDYGFGFTDIVGATGPAYRLGVADVGTSLRVRVTATNADASVVATSIASSAVRAGPPVNTAAPTISGSARRTSTLTSTRGEWGGIENEYAYQWQRDGVDIAGASDATYTLQSADVGAKIRLRVTASNLDGTLSAYSAATIAVAAAPPRNVEPRSVSEEARLGATLTASRGDWTPAGADFAYAWHRGGATIAGATGATYTLQAADVGKTVRVGITATNVDGSVSATSAATARVAAPPVNTVAPPAPSGTAMETSTLTAVPGTWDTADASFTYTWMRCPAYATGITASCEEAGTGGTCTLAAADVGRRLGVRVTASSSGGTTTAGSALTATIARLTLVNTTPPSIAGNPYVGETLTGDAGRWTFPSAELTYHWRRCDADGTSNCASVGDGSSRYTLDEQDAGRAIVLVVAASAPGQSATAQSHELAIRARPVPRPVSAPAVTGTAQRGRTLTAGAGTWSNDPDRFSYQWLRCDGGGCRDIGGATGNGYVLTKTDEGFAVTVVVTASNAFGSGSATAAPTGPVAAAPPVNTRVPVITGTLQQGATLTVGGFAWDATPDTVYSLAWLRCDAGGCAPILGASGAQYTLIAADVARPWSP